jgi:hypothetical protein
MTRFMALLGAVAIVLALATAFAAIWTNRDPTAELELLDKLLSWKVIVGGLTLAGGLAFRTEIAQRIAGQPMVSARNADANR